MSSLGSASTMGLMSTSVMPPPTAHRQTAHSTPTYGSAVRYGRTPSATSPAAAKAWAATMARRVPMTLIHFADKRSTSICTPKFTVMSRLMRPMEMPRDVSNTTNSSGVRLFTTACVMYPR